ncbi:hypothetical protein ACFL3I_10810, partial [Pseudomonadota bacterium]
GSEVAGQGFYNLVTGSRTDNAPDNNDACTNLPDPKINLAKTVNGPAVDNGDGTFTVEYTITATNSDDGPGSYDVVDTFTPGVGITLVEDGSTSAAIVYGTGPGESGVVTPFFNSGDTAVDDATLAGQSEETWIVTGIFTVDPAFITVEGSDCKPDDGEEGNTGFSNGVSGSTNDDDLTDNITCVELPVIDLLKTAADPELQLDGPYEGTYKVVYTVTAANLGEAAGVYNIDDALSPATGLTLVVDAGVPTPSIAYNTGETEDGVTGLYPNLVTGEGLAAGATESWFVTAYFELDPTQDLTDARTCEVGSEVAGQGFYNLVTGSRTDNAPDNNDACTRLSEPLINLAKSAEPAVLIDGNTWEIVYTITATNTADGPGVYNLVDTLMPGAGITPIVDTSYPAIVYAGGEVRTGDITAPPLSNGGTWVTNEGLAGRASESWTVTARFSVDLDTLIANPMNADCNLTDGESGTGYFNYIEGSESETDFSDNDACVPHFLPAIGTPTLGNVALLLMMLLMLGTAGVFLRPGYLSRFK